MRAFLAALACVCAFATVANGAGWSSVHRYVHPTGHCGGMREVLSSTYGYESGPRTASGEPFIPNKITAASRIFSLRTWITARNPRTGRTARVWVNDRGPFGEAYAQGAVMDFSIGTGNALGMRGAEYICVQ